MRWCLVVVVLLRGAEKHSSGRFFFLDKQVEGRKRSIQELILKKRIIVAQ
jgi:hypothetical protein